MSGLKNSIIALAVLMILVGALAALLPLISLGQVTPGPKQPTPSVGRPGNFYLTKTNHNGAEALTACAVGDHMASIWELQNPSNLAYSTAYGLQWTDSGLGPPTGGGWIRTGAAASGAAPDPHKAFTTLANCLAWTSANASDFGNLVNLHIPWLNEPDANMAPWKISSASCNTKTAVWCVQD
jgi:hypothetical protein